MFKAQQMYKFRPASLTINSVLFDEEYELLIKSECCCFFYYYSVRKVFYLVTVKYF